MIVSHSRKFVFVHIHKTGGTSLTLGVDPFLAWDDVVLGGTPRGQAVNDTFRKRFGLDKHSPVSAIERVCGADLLDRYFGFALVRHPVARLCSLYNFVGFYVNRWSNAHAIPISEIPAHVERNPGVLKDAPQLGWKSSQAFCLAPGFSGFIRSEFLRTDPGDRGQAERLQRTGGRAPVRAFRLEEREAWLPELRRLLGFDFELPHANKAKTVLVRTDALDVQDIRFIETTYADDYATFGY